MQWITSNMVTWKMVTSIITFFFSSRETYDECGSWDAMVDKGGCGLPHATSIQAERSNNVTLGWMREGSDLDTM